MEYLKEKLERAFRQLELSRHALYICANDPKPSTYSILMYQLGAFHGSSGALFKGFTRLMSEFAKNFVTNDSPMPVELIQKSLDDVEEFLNEQVV